MRADGTLGELYHGTAAPLADPIRQDGLRPGADGRVYLTDSREMALVYAQWGAVAHELSGGAWAPETDVGRECDRQAADAGHPVAVVCKVRPWVRFGEVPLDVEDGASAPPLPWQTTTAAGEGYMTTDHVPASAVGPYEIYPVPELADPARLDDARRDIDLIAEAFPRFGDPSSGAFRSAIPRPAELIDAARTASPNVDSPWHGDEHWLGVAAMGVRLLDAGAPADPAVLFAFAVLHDSQRQAESGDPEHGARAAGFAASLQGHELTLTHDQLAVLADALTRHDNGDVSDEPTIGACWDADRLTLARLGATIDAAYLSTRQGRDLAAGAAELVEVVCDWPWAIYRYQLNAAREHRNPQLMLEAGTVAS